MQLAFPITRAVSSAKAKLWTFRQVMRLKPLQRFIALPMLAGLTGEDNGEGHARKN